MRLESLQITQRSDYGKYAMATNNNKMPWPTGDLSFEFLPIIAVGLLS